MTNDFDRTDFGNLYAAIGHRVRSERGKDPVDDESEPPQLRLSRALRHVQLGDIELRSRREHLALVASRVHDDGVGPTVAQIAEMLSVSEQTAVTLVQRGDAIRAASASIGDAATESSARPLLDHLFEE